MDYTPRRVSNVFLCMVPVLAIALAAPRALRVSGIYQTVGGVLFAAIVIAAWILGARAIRAGAEGDQKLALTGALLLTPFALVALLWVGLGPPWNASPAENVMRYLVLLVSSIAVSGGFVVLKEALSEAGERQYSTLGFAAAMLAGAAYLIWMSLLLGAYIVKVRDGHVPPAINSLIDAFDVLLDVACLLTYLATAAFAVSMGRTGWLGARRDSRLCGGEHHRVAFPCDERHVIPRPGGSFHPVVYPTRFRCRNSRRPIYHAVSVGSRSTATRGR
jgi:hypothetical protein